MADYTYTREFGDTIHSNPDGYNIDHPGETISLGAQILTDLSKRCKIKCDDTAITITFASSLTSAEKTTLDNTVATHKAAVDWPPI